MSKRLKISVIAIFYDSEKYVRKCLDSIIGQENVEVELIAVDDCSKDNTLQILREYERECNRCKSVTFKIIHHDSNKGISAARNSGIENFTGDCFYFIDGDDYLPSGALSNLSKNFDDNVDWVQGSYEIVDEADKTLRHLKYISGKYNSHEEIINNFGNIEFVYTHNRLVNKRFSDIRFPASKAHEDRFWNVSAFPRLKCITTIADVTYNYVAHSSSFSSKSRASEKYIDSAIELVDKIDSLEQPCWINNRDTFIITAIEKNLYLWKQNAKYRKKCLEWVLRHPSQIDIIGFPRFTKVVHKLIHNSFPDWFINFVSACYRQTMLMTNRPV